MLNHTHLVFVWIPGSDRALFEMKYNSCCIRSSCNVSWSISAFASTWVRRWCPACYCALWKGKGWRLECVKQLQFLAALKAALGCDLGSALVVGPVPPWWGARLCPTVADWVLCKALGFLSCQFVHMHAFIYPNSACLLISFDKKQSLAT